MPCKRMVPALSLALDNPAHIQHRNFENQRKTSISNPQKHATPGPHPNPEGGGGYALEGKGPQRRPQKRLEEVAKAGGGGYCWL